MNALKPLVKIEISNIKCECCRKNEEDEPDLSSKKENVNKIKTFFKKTYYPCCLKSSFCLKKKNENKKSKFTPTSTN